MQKTPRVCKTETELCASVSVDAIQAGQNTTMILRKVIIDLLRSIIGGIVSAIQRNGFSPHRRAIHSAVEGIHQV